MVIGSGPGGYVAAIKAAQLGLKVRILKSIIYFLESKCVVKLLHYLVMKMLIYLNASITLQRA